MGGVMRESDAGVEECQCAGAVANAACGRRRGRPRGRPRRVPMCVLVVVLSMVSVLLLTGLSGTQGQSWEAGPPAQRNGPRRKGQGKGSRGGRSADGTVMAEERRRARRSGGAAGRGSVAKECMLSPVASTLYGRQKLEQQIQAGSMPKEQLGAALAGSAVLREIRIMRVPKAASSTLARAAMHFVGCKDHVMPNCGVDSREPDTDTDACKRVYGCVGHGATLPSAHEFAQEREGGRVALSTVRHPGHRSVAAFLMPKQNASAADANMHVNTDHTDPTCAHFGPPSEMDACFKKHMANPRYTNILTKMYSGRYGAYSNAADLGAHDVAAATEMMQRFSFVLVTEAWQLSVLALYAEVPELRPASSFLFRLHIPSWPQHPAMQVGLARRAAASSASSATGAANTLDARETQRLMAEGAALRAQVYDDLYKRHKQELLEAEALDMDLYKAAISRLCDALKRHGLWERERVRGCWRVSLGTVDTWTECARAAAEQTLTTRTRQQQQQQQQQQQEPRRQPRQQPPQVSTLTPEEIEAIIAKRAAKKRRTVGGPQPKEGGRDPRPRRQQAPYGEQQLKFMNLPGR